MATAVNEKKMAKKDVSSSVDLSKWQQRITQREKFSAGVTPAHGSLKKLKFTGIARNGVTDSNNVFTKNVLVHLLGSGGDCVICTDGYVYSVNGSGVHADRTKLTAIGGTLLAAAGLTEKLAINAFEDETETWSVAFKTVDNNSITVYLAGNSSGNAGCQWSATHTHTGVFASTPTIWLGALDYSAKLRLEAGYTLHGFKFGSCVGGSVISTTGLVSNAPSDITLDGGTAGHITAPTLDAGALAAVDADSGEVFAYIMHAGTGDTDNADYQVVGNHIQAKAATSAGSKAIRVAAIDSTGQEFEHAFTITINAAMSDMALSNNTVTAPATTVGDLSVTGGTTPYTYALCKGSGDTNNNLFTITDEHLTFTLPSVAGTYYLRVKATDARSTTFEHAFTVTVS